MFLYRRNPTETEKLLERIKENEYKLELSDRDGEISSLRLELAIKDCTLALRDLQEVTRQWQK